MRIVPFTGALAAVGVVLLGFQQCSQAKFQSVSRVPTRTDFRSAGSGDATGEIQQPAASDGALGDPVSQCMQNGAYQVQAQNGNVYLLYQDGPNNTAATVQIGHDNQSTITQTGGNNLACVNQNGQNNISTVNQSGTATGTSLKNISIVSQVSPGSAPATSGSSCLCAALALCQAHPDSPFCVSLQP